MEAKKIIGPEQARVAASSRRLVTAKAISEITGVTLRQVYRMAERGIMPKPVSLGYKTKRWRIEVIEEWLDAGCPTANAQVAGKGRI